MAPFQPILDRARWRIVYEELLRPAPIDQIITYGEIAPLVQSSDRGVISSAVQRARRELEQADQRTLVTLPTVGYRIAKPSEHLGLAARDQKHATRTLKAGQSKVMNVDMNALNEAERKQMLTAGMAFGVILERVRRLDIRQKRTQQAVVEIQQRSERTEQEVAELRERLAALESRA